jgi:hypothetical protein
MANLGKGIDVNEAVKDFKSGYEVVEPGWKTVVIDNSEVKDTSTSGGKMLVLNYALQDGSGRNVTDRLNIMNKSDVAQKIGQATLAKIAKCIGIEGTLNNSDVLHGKPFDVKIVIEPFRSNKANDKGEYPMIDSNKVKDYKPKGEGISAQATEAPEATEGEKAASSW